MKTADASRDRVLWLELIKGSGDYAPATMEPVDGVTLPHVTLPACGPDGQRCRGFGLTLCQPPAWAAEAQSGGFDVTVWKLVTTLCRWARWAVPTVTGLGYGQQLVSYDAGAGAALFFQFGNIDQGGGEIAQRSRVIIAVAGLS